YPADKGWGTLNGIATLGSFLIAISILLFFINVLVSLRKPRTAPADPWQGDTLEWPPHLHLPPTTSTHCPGSARSDPSTTPGWRARPKKVAHERARSGGRAVRESPEQQL